jgi:AcrR family transcriptional regulator
VTAKTQTVPVARPEAVEDGIEVDTQPVCARPMRADAVKNRQRILDAAEAIFATEGVAVPIDAVAERARVGVGTLYRHFPTKEALFEAIVVDRLGSLLEMAKSHAGAADPGDALFSFLGQFAQQASAKHDLFDALSSAGIDIKSSCAEMVDELKRNVDVLRQRAVAAGSVRSDVSTDEMIALVVGVCQGQSHSGCDDAAVRRMVRVVCDGLRAPLTP